MHLRKQVEINSCLKGVKEGVAAADGAAEGLFYEQRCDGEAAGAPVLITGQHSWVSLVPTRCSAPSNEKPFNT